MSDIGGVDLGQPAPASVSSEGTNEAWTCLRDLLAREAILHGTREHVLRSRNGRIVPWMFYSWNVSLTAPGLGRICESILRELETFQSTQLASFGYTSLPLLTGCLVQGGGRFTGLALRDQRKPYGSCRQIEGSGDRGRPVVVIDDSLSSGTSLRGAIHALEAEGFQVEGAVCLVHFAGRGGRESVEALGYRVACVFDVWDDLGFERPSYVPYPRRLALPWSLDARIEEGLHPATAARRVAEYYLQHAMVPMPPQTLDRVYDGRGGVYVSFRDRDSDFRLSRDGFWHFDPGDSEPGRDLVLAVVKTLASTPSLTAERLRTCKIAVTFLGPLERIEPRDLDFDRYGIVVRGIDSPTKLGGALPNTQYFTSEIEQYLHARQRNAGISLYERHELYRHPVTRYVEPGESWLPYGAGEESGGWRDDLAVGERLLARVRQALLSPDREETLPGPAVADDLIPDRIWAVSVTLFSRGILGCWVAWNDSLDECLLRAARRALGIANQRRNTPAAERDDVTVIVTILTDREWLGAVPLESAARKLRLGLDALGAQKGGKHALFLPFVGPYYSWTQEELAARLLEKAGIEPPGVTWTTFRTQSWLGTPEGAASAVRFGFPARTGRLGSSTDIRDVAAALAGYIAGQLGPDGLPRYQYDPFRGTQVAYGSASRIVLAIGALELASRVLGRPDLGAKAASALATCVRGLTPSETEPWLNLPGHTASDGADGLLVSALSDAGHLEVHRPTLRALVERVLSFVRSDGAVLVDPVRRLSADHDFLPGVALLAIGRYARAAGAGDLLPDLEASLNWYRRRFRLAHPWGMVGWHPQAWAELQRTTRSPEQAAFVFEIADWALKRHHTRSGAFISEMHPRGPTFQTGFFLEGVAEAWRLAVELGDSKRADDYRESWLRGLAFLECLIVDARDVFGMADPERCLGGVRESLTRAMIRIDYVAHALIAMLKGLRLLEGPPDDVEPSASSGNSR